MYKLVINGGTPLKGSIKTSGSKNATLPIFFSSILADGPLKLSNTPQLSDVSTTLRLLMDMGSNFVLEEDGSIFIDSSTLTNLTAEYSLVKTMRASILTLGPMLAKYKKAKISLPGGCAIGTRPVNLHLDALEKMGATIEVKNGYIYASTQGLVGSQINFDLISVTATENIIMAACLAKGESKIKNIAIEPEVIDLVDCLKSMGANIELTDNRTILIQGVDEMKGTSHTIIPDRIEALTYVIAGALNAENLLIKDINISHIQNVLDSLVKLNIAMEIKDNEISVKKTSIEEGIELDTEEFPGFPTDLQAQMMVLMSLGKKKSIIKENIFENRFMHVPELNRMGGNIEISGKKAIIHPCDGFLGAQVMATDLRASVSLVLAGLVADGETTLNRIYHLDRGYENIEKKLQACGADIKRI